VTKSRLRNLALPLALAALATILIGIYVVSYRNSVTHGAANSHTEQCAAGFG